jgi:hypothetical protein
MTISNILGSEPVITLVGGVLGGVWALFKSSDWYDRVRRRRYAKALEALEAGVEIAYRTYVAECKAAHADGQLTEEEKRRAREIARERAVEFGRTHGVDVLRELGREYLDLWIAKLVKGLKQR